MNNYIDFAIIEYDLTFINEYKGKLTDAEIINDIQRVAKELDKDYISISTYR